MPHFDLAIVGSGSGNSLVTPYWDDKKVAIIDGGTFGGTCLNVGCIPTKMYAYPATLAASAPEASRLGVPLSRGPVDWPAIRDRVFGRIDAISEGGRHYRAEELPNTTLFAEHVRFTGPRSLVTDSGTEITAERVVVAAGSRPVLPDVPGIGLPQVHTSDTVMRLPELPRRVVVVGGGFIAAEFCHVFHWFGAEVVQVNRSRALLRQNDAEVSRRFTEAAAKRWRVELGHELSAVEERAGGGVRVRFHAAGGGDETLALDADVVLVATGRTPNTDRLDAAAAGFDVHSDGRLAVDPQLRVLAGGEPLEGVYSLGDVSSPAQLKHVANREARVVAHNLEHPGDQRAVDHRFIPSAVFSGPQVASVGLSEGEARAECGPGEEVVCSVQEYGTTAYGWAMEDDEGFVKLVAERASGRLLGAHILGHEASLLIQPLVQAMVAGTRVQDLARGPYWIHPALMEVVENALLSLGIAPGPGDPL